MTVCFHADKRGRRDFTVSTQRPDSLLSDSSRRNLMSSNTATTGRQSNSTELYKSTGNPAMSPPQFELQVKRIASSVKVLMFSDHTLTSCPSQYPWIGMAKWFNALGIFPADAVRCHFAYAVRIRTSKVMYTVYTQLLTDSFWRSNWTCSQIRKVWSCRRSWFGQSQSVLSCWCNC